MLCLGGFDLYPRWVPLNVSKPCTSSAFLEAIPAVETSFYCIHVTKDNRRNVNK